jgi:hypothetical protein
MSIFFFQGKEYFIPEHLIRKHCFETEDNDYGITTCYYYKKKRKTEVLPNKIQPDYISTIKEYEEDVFYKLTSISRKSNHFDYFIKLKDKSPRIVILKNNVHSEELKPEKYVSEYGKLDTKQIKVQF